MGSVLSQRRFPLAEGASAFARLAEGKQLGKIVIEVNS